MSLDLDIAINDHLDAHDIRCGTVFKKTIGTYTVHADGRTIVCAISNKLRKELIFPIADPTSFRKRVMSVEEINVVDPVAVGDEVRFALAADGSGMITEVLPRRCKLARTRSRSGTCWTAT
jgi:putative ribosome biogenesis GTPase RsgA